MGMHDWFRQFYDKNHRQSEELVHWIGTFWQEKILLWFGCFQTGKLQIFDIASGTLLESVEAHSGAVWSITLAPDKRGLVSGSADHEVKFWDFELITDEEYSSTRYVVLISLKEVGLQCIKYEHIQIWTHTYINTDRYEHRHVHRHICTQTYMNTYSYEHTYMNIWIQTDMNTNIYEHGHITMDRYELIQIWTWTDMNRYEQTDMNTQIWTQTYKHRQIWTQTACCYNKIKHIVHKRLFNGQVYSDSLYLNVT